MLQQLAYEEMLQQLADVLLPYQLLPLLLPYLMASDLFGDMHHRHISRVAATYTGCRVAALDIPALHTAATASASVACVHIRPNTYPPTPPH